MFYSYRFSCINWEPFYYDFFFSFSFGAAFGSDSDNPHLPHNHEHDQVVYTGTHDNDTVRPKLTSPTLFSFPLPSSHSSLFLVLSMHLYNFRLSVGGRTCKRKRSPQWVSWETLTNFMHTCMSRWSLLMCACYQLVAWYYHIIRIVAKHTKECQWISLKFHSTAHTQVEETAKKIKLFIRGKNKSLLWNTYSDCPEIFTEKCVHLLANMRLVVEVEFDSPTQVTHHDMLYK